MLSMLVIAFLPRSKRLLISWLWLPSAVILEPKKIKSVTFSPSICHGVMGLDAMILVFWMLSFKPTFHFPLSLSSRGSLVPLHFLPQGWCHLHIWGYWYFSRQSWVQLALHPIRHFTWCTLQPVHSEDQPWDFFGGNDAKAETPVLWPPHVKSWLIGKDADAGKDWWQ